MKVVVFVVIALAVIAVGGWLAARFEHRKKESHTDPFGIVHPPTIQATQTTRRESTPVSPPPPTPVFDVPALPPPINPLVQVKDRLRARKASGSSVTSALDGVSAEFTDKVSLDSCIRIALEVGYPPTDVAKFMAGRKYDTREIASMLSSESLSVDELADIVAPLVSGTDIVSRTEETFEVVKDAFDLKDDDEDLLKLPSHMGCSEEDSAMVIYHKTGMQLGAVLRGLGLCSRPDFCAGIAKKLDVDLSDGDEYDSIRENGDIDFNVAAAILKACGQNAETVIRAENDNNPFSDDELDEVFSSLSAAGYKNVEIMKGILDAEIASDNVHAAVIEAAIEKKVSIKEIVALLKEENVDIDDLDAEMRDREIETPTRIDILYSYLHAGTKSAEKELSASL